MPSREYLQKLGEEKGWEPRALSHEELDTMGGDEYDWHLLFNPKAFDNLSAAEYRGRAIQQRPADWLDPRMWNLRAKEIEKAVASFLSLRPQYKISNESRQILLDTVRDLGLPITVTTLTQVFDELISQKRLVPNPDGVLVSGITKRIDFAQTKI